MVMAIMYPYLKERMSEYLFSLHSYALLIFVKLCDIVRVTITFFTK